MKKIPHNNFSQQRRKEKSLSLLPLDVRKVIWHGKSWGLRRGSRPNFEWVPSRIQKFRIAAKRRTEIFVLLGGSGGMLPRKILKIKLLRLLEIAFPTNILKITFFPSSHKLLFQLEIFSNKFHSLWRQKRHNCISGLLKSVNNV